MEQNQAAAEVAASEVRTAEVVADDISVVVVAAVEVVIEEESSSVVAAVVEHRGHVEGKSVQQAKLHRVAEDASFVVAVVAAVVVSDHLAVALMA